MYRIIGGDGREYGPVSLEQIQLWIAQRRAGPATLVRLEGLIDWAPLSAHGEFAADLAAIAVPPLPESAVQPPPLPPAAVVSGARHGEGSPARASGPAASTTGAPATGADAGGGTGRASPDFNDAADVSTSVAGGVGPAGSVATAGGPATSSDADVTVVDVDPLDAGGYIVRCLARRYELNVSDAISRGYDVVARQLVLSMASVLTIAMVQATCALLPVIALLNLALSGVFDGGLAFFFLAVVRGGRATLGDAFTGFRVQFLQLALLSVMQTMPLVVLVALWQARELPANPFGVGGMSAAVLVLALPVIYLLVSWTFAPFLVIDRGLGFWDALELSRRVASRRWFKLLFLHLAFLPIHLAGALCFGVGLLYTAALKRATLAVLYEEIFRE